MAREVIDGGLPAEPVAERSSRISSSDPQVAHVLALQRSAGNAAVCRMASTGGDVVIGPDREPHPPNCFDAVEQTLARAVAHRVLARGSCSSSTPAPAGLCTAPGRKCATHAECITPDSVGAADASGAWKLDIAIDIEVEDASNVSAATVGHTYVHFKGADGKEWTYGFYSPTDDQPTEFKYSVKPCTVHPDRFHERCVDHRIHFTLSAQQYSDALEFAQAWCGGGPGITPNYHLFDNNCTTFARKVAEKAGQKLPNARGKVGGGPGLTADNPNTLMDSIRGLATKGLTSDSAIREWLSKHSYDEIFALQQAEKLRLINRLLDGYVSDDDLQGVEWVCLGVRDKGKMDDIEKAIRPRIAELNERQGKRLDAILSNRTFK